MDCNLEQETISRIIKLKEIKKKRKNNDYRVVKEIEEYLALYPDDYYGMVEAGRIYMYNNQFEKAEEYLKKVYESEADNKYSALVLLGSLEERRKNIPLAKYYYNKAIEESPNLEIFAVRSLAKFERQEGNIEQAIRLLKLIKEVAGDYYARDMADIMIEQKEYDKALKYLDTLPDDVNHNVMREISLMHGICMEKIGCYEEALYDFDMAKMGKRKYGNDYVYLKACYEEALVYYDLKDYDKALEVCKKINAKRYVLVNFLLAKIYDAKGEVENAKKYYEKSLSLDKMVYRRESAYYIGNCLTEMGQYDEAAHYYKGIIDSSDFFCSDVYYRLVAVKVRQEKYEEALEILEEMLQKDKYICNEGTYQYIKFFIEYKLGKLKNLDLDNLTYRQKQIVNFSLDNTINFTKRNYVHSRYRNFAEDVDIEALIIYASENLDEENKVKTMVIDTYDIDYPNVGYDHGEICDKVRVLTIPNTKNIFKVFPIDEVTLKDKMKAEKKREENNGVKVLKK